MGSLWGDAFLSKKGFYCYAFNAEGRRVPEPTPWSAFGLFWGLGEEDKARRTLARLNGKDIPFREVRTERAVRPVVRSGRGQARLSGYVEQKVVLLCR